MYYLDIEATCRNLTLKIKNSNYSVADIAQAMGVSSQAIYRWMSTSQPSMPTVDNLVVLSALLGCTLDELVVLDELPEKL